MTLTLQIIDTLITVFGLTAIIVTFGFSIKAQMIRKYHKDLYFKQLLNKALRHIEDLEDWGPIQ